MYLVSACLAGSHCRYNGSNCVCKAVQDMVNQGKAVPVCPEQLAGLPTPRGPHEIIVDDKGHRKVIDKNGKDSTDSYAKGAEQTLALCLALGIKNAILKSKSPSCGCGQIYDGTFSGRLVNGDGLTAELLKKNGIRVQTEEALEPSVYVGAACAP